MKKVASIFIALWKSIEKHEKSALGNTADDLCKARRTAIEHI